MKHSIIKKLVAASISFTLVFAPVASHACTAVNIVAKDGSVVAGRTMEWAYEMKWQLTSNPKGTPISLSAPASLKLPASTQPSKHAFVAIAPGILAGPLLI